MTKRFSSLLALTALAGAAALATTIAVGCSSSSSDGGGGGTTYTSAKPPARPTATATGTDKWFAVNGLKLGVSPRSSTKVVAGSWKDYGFDIDQRNTTADDSKANNNTCARQSGANSSTLVDGTNGIDNNFGGKVMGVIQSVKPDAEETVNTSIAEGSFTLILHLKNFTETDNSDVKGELFIASDYGDKTGAAKKAPAFSTADTDWPVLPSSLNDGATIASGAKLQFATGYVSNGYWISGDFGGSASLPLTISIAGNEISLPIDAAVIMMKVDGSEGTIAGAMEVTKLKGALGPIAENFGLCPGNATYESVIGTLTSSADLTANTPTDHFNKVGVTCDAISVGLGFSAKPTAVPTLIHDPSTGTGTSQCDGDAGVDGGAG